LKQNRKNRAWRSLGKWFSRAKTIGWVHKHRYPRSLNLKAVFPQSQTVAIASAAARRSSCRPSTQPHFASTIDWRSAQRARRTASSRSQCRCTVLSMIAHTAGMDVEYYVAPAMVGLRQVRARHEQADEGTPNMAHRTFNPAQRPASKRSAHMTGTGTPSRPLTKLRTIDETAELFNTSTRTFADSSNRVHCQRTAWDSGGGPAPRPPKAERGSET
jgi:hypothetical protein